MLATRGAGDSARSVPVESDLYRAFASAPGRAGKCTIQVALDRHGAGRIASTSGSEHASLHSERLDEVALRYRDNWV